LRREPDNLELGEGEKPRHDHGYEVFGKIGIRRYLRDFVLLARLGDDGPRLRLGAPYQIEAAEQLGGCVQNSDLLAAGARDDADGAHQLILDGQAAIEEGDDELLGAAGER